MPLSQTDEEIGTLFSYGALPNAENAFDISKFLYYFNRTLKSKAPTLSKIKPKTDVKSTLGAGASSSQAFEKWELEKKYKTKLEAL